MGGADRLKEPFASPILLLARAFLDRVVKTLREEKGEDAQLTTSSTAWNSFAYQMSSLVSRYLEVNPVKSSTINPFGELVPILRQELVISTLIATRAQHNDVLHSSRSIAAVERQLRILRKAYSGIEGDLKIGVLARIESSRRLLAEYRGRNSGD